MVIYDLRMDLERVGCLERFLRRHPELSLRISAQVIKRARNEATIEGLRMFFKELLQHTIERKLTPDRLWNMDETGFAQKQKSRKVIAFNGSGNMWTKSADANFHMTYVVAVSATGIVAPPLMIIPGQRLNRDLLDGCDIPGARGL